MVVYYHLVIFLKKYEKYPLNNWYYFVGAWYNRAGCKLFYDLDVAPDIFGNNWRALGLDEKAGNEIRQSAYKKSLDLKGRAIFYFKMSFVFCEIFSTFATILSLPYNTRKAQRLFFL